MFRSSLSQVYELPINEAASELGIGVTVLKKFCRKFAVGRWPYRKLTSVDKLIQTVEDSAAENPDMAMVRGDRGHQPCATDIDIRSAVTFLCTLWGDLMKYIS